MGGHSVCKEGFVPLTHIICNIARKQAISPQSIRRSLSENAHQFEQFELHLFKEHAKKRGAKKTVGCKKKRFDKKSLNCTYSRVYVDRFLRTRTGRKANFEQFELHVFKEHAYKKGSTKARGGGVFSGGNDTQGNAKRMVFFSFGFFKEPT